MLGLTEKSSDPNFPTGRDGLIAVDKVGNKVIFLDPVTLATIEVLSGFAPRVHELAISPDHSRAYAPIYGDGIHGHNPNPGHLIAVFDLQLRRHTGDFSVAPFLAPHTMRWGPAGQLYCVCEDSGVVVELHAGTGEMAQVLDVGSVNAHRIEVLPDGSKLYTENEEDTFATVLDLRLRRRLKDIPAPNGLAGLGLSPDGRTIVMVDAKIPELLIVDTATDVVLRAVRLVGHAHAAQIARYSPDGRYLVVTSHNEAIGTVLSSDLETQRSFPLGRGSMDMAFHPDGRSVLVANQGDGTISIVDLEEGIVHRTMPAGDGVESLAFF
jgi:DNA-binding beta-propeller fold protein YncE